MIYHIEEPDLLKISKERKDFLNKDLIEIYIKNNLEKYLNEDYYSWSKLKYQILPKELESHEELRYVIKFFRFGQPIPIKTEDWKVFTLGKPHFLEEFLHNIDYWLWWDFFGKEISESEKKTFLQNWIAEEAISSSQLEWAMTSSKEAKKIIAEKRKPMNVSERMIVNNYRAMLYIKEEVKDKELSKENLLELQKIITEGTLDDKKDEWRYRQDSDEVVVADKITGAIYYIAPKETFFKEQLEILLDYANDKDWKFTHPFVKSVILHFWIAYLHPFCDWNGRTARAIFYWYLLKKWYWGFNYVPISKVIKDSKKQYGESFLNAEQDGLDLTYFLVYISKKTKQAFEEFREYIWKQRKKQKDWLRLFMWTGLNDRQIRLLDYLINHKEWYTNMTIHRNYYGISPNTAIADLEKLRELWFLMANKEGKYKNYYPVNDFDSKIKDIQNN